MCCLRGMGPSQRPHVSLAGCLLPLQVGSEFQSSFIVIIHFYSQYYLLNVFWDFLGKEADGQNCCFISPYNNQSMPGWPWTRNGLYICCTLPSFILLSNILISCLVQNWMLMFFSTDVWWITPANPSRFLLNLRSLRKEKGACISFISHFFKEFHW